MALATDTDVIAHLGRPLNDAEQAKIAALLNEASDLVIGYCGTDFTPAPYPGAVVRVVAAVAARSLLAGSSAGGGMVQQQSAGPFSVTLSSAASSGDVWLTAADKIKLRPYRRGGGLTSVPLAGERHGFGES